VIHSNVNNQSLESKEIQDNQLEDFSIKKLEKELEALESEAEINFGDINKVLLSSKEKRDLDLEFDVRKRMRELASLEKEEINAIVNFVSYGTESIRDFAVRDRLDLVNFYKTLFDKFPKEQEDWRNIIKIFNGRWVDKRNLEKEEDFKKEFRKIYLREVDLENNYDANFIMIASYSLRIQERDLDKEKFSIEIFRKIYNRFPSSFGDWNIVRAIAYSGAKR